MSCKRLKNAVNGKRPVRILKVRWIEALEENSKKLLRVRNWNREAMDRQVWIVYKQEAKARFRAAAPQKKKSRPPDAVDRAT